MTEYVIKNPYALSDKRLVHISETKRSRLKKDYACPNCRGPMIAKLGKGKNTPHFAHAGENCSISYESLIHLLSKIYLSQNLNAKLGFPSSIFSKSSPVFEALGIFMNTKQLEFTLEKLLEASLISCPVPRIEKNVGPYRADLLFECEEHGPGHELVIEILHTHESEAEKIQYLYENDIFFIEVKPEFKVIGEHTFLEFSVHSTNLEVVLEEDEQWLHEELYKFVFQKHRARLLNDLQYQLTSDEQVQLQKKVALQEIHNELPKLNLKDYIAGKQRAEIIYTPATASHRYDEVVKVENIGPNGSINGMPIKNEKAILIHLLRNLKSENLDIQALVEIEYRHGQPKRHVSGFNFGLPRLVLTATKMKDILLVLLSKL